MKIQVDGTDLMEINEMQQKVMCCYLKESEFEEDMKRRIMWVVTHKYEQCLKKFRDEWECKMKQEGAKSIPCNDEEFCAMILARDDYKDREAREKEARPT